MTDSSVEPAPNAIRFLLGWGLANIVGVSMGLVLSGGFIVIVSIIGFAVAHGAPGSWVVTALAILMVVGGAGLLGGLIGAGQGLVLHKRVSAYGWILASIGGNMLGSLPAVLASVGLAAGLNNGVLAWAVGALLLGAVVGVAQWFIIRRRVSRSGWWIAASVVAYLIGGLIASMTVSPISMGQGGIAVLILTLLVTAAAFSAVTGGTWVWLMRQPAPERDSPVAIAP